MEIKKLTTQPSENRESRVLANHCLELSRQLGITKLLVFAESVLDQRYLLEKIEQEEIILFTRNIARVRSEISSRCTVLPLPEQHLSRSDQLQLGLLMAVLQGLVECDETVLCLTGLVGSLRLDNLLITNLVRDNKWFRNNDITLLPQEIMRSQTFIRLLDIAVSLAKQGREGKKIGTIFVLGNSSEYGKYLKQLVLNPFKGHGKTKRYIHDGELLETIREYSSLDGAFVIDNDGYLERAGVLINAPSSAKVKMQKGYGTRHAAAANLTALSRALCITISESSSVVTIFFNGSAVLQLSVAG